MFKFIPYHHIRLATSLSRDEAEQRLSRSASAESPRPPSGSGTSDTPLFGTVSREGFHLSRRLPGRNSFRPVMYGEFTETPQGVVVDIRITLRPQVIAFCTACVGVIALAFSFPLRFTLVQRFAVPLATFAVIYLQAIIQFNIEFDSTVRLVRQCLNSEATSSEHTLSPHAQMPLVSRLWRVLLTAYFIGFLGFMLYDFTFNLPKANKQRLIVEAEYSQLALPPSTRLLAHSASNKTGLASESSTYSTQLSYQDIHHFYAAELPRHGWQLIKEEPQDNRDRDLGGKMAYYRKGHYIIALQWAGDGAHSGWDYSINISWR